MKVRTFLRACTGRRRIPIVAAVAATVLTLPALWTGWQADDYFHRFILLDSPGFPEFRLSPMDLFTLFDGDPERNARAMDLGLLPWWAVEDLRLAFWRPISSLTHWLDYRLWPDTAGLMHVQSLAWYAAAVALAAVLYRRLIQPAWVALLAALLFAVDDAHGIPVSWLANRNVIVAGAFALLALWAHDRWRRDGWRPGAVLGPLALLLGLLASESAVGIGAYLLTHALFLDAGSQRRRALALLPHLVIGLGWWLTYRGLGYGAVGSGFYIDPARSPLRFIGAVFERGPVLLQAQWGVLSADIAMILSFPARQLFTLAALGYLALLFAVFAPLIRADRWARFWLFGMILSVLPVSCVFPSDRMLFFVGFGAMGLLAQFLGGLHERASWRIDRRWWRTLAKPVAVVLIAVHCVIGPISLPLRAWTPAMIGPRIVRLIESLPSDPAITGQHLIAINAPDVVIGAYLPILRALNGQPIPAHTRMLAPASQPLEVARTDQRTLVIRPALGFLPLPGTPLHDASGRSAHVSLGYVSQHINRMYRSDNDPMVLNQRIELTGVRVKVTALTEDGRPAEASLRFAVPLEDPSLRWVQYKNGEFVPFEPPPIGETVRIEPVTPRLVEW